MSSPPPQYTYYLQRVYVSPADPIVAKEATQVELRVRPLVHFMLSRLTHRLDFARGEPFTAGEGDGGGVLYHLHEAELPSSIVSPSLVCPTLI